MGFAFLYSQLKICINKNSIKHSAKKTELRRKGAEMKRTALIAAAALTVAFALTGCGRANNTGNTNGGNTTSATSNSSQATTSRSETTPMNGNNNNGNNNNGNNPNSNNNNDNNTNHVTGDVDGDGFVEDIVTEAGDIVNDVVTGAEDIVDDVL